MADAFVIETAQFTAGIVAAQRRGFRFYASHPAMQPLEGHCFASPHAAQQAAERLARAVVASERPARAHV